MMMYKRRRDASKRFADASAPQSDGWEPKGFIRLKTLLINLIILAIIGGVGFLAFTWIKERKLFVNEWFVGGMLKGVDISSYQAEVDMESLTKQGIRFVYIKATEGSGHVDAKFETNWQLAKEAGLLAGAYHFFSFESSGETQAENYIVAVGDLDGCLIPAIDVEMYGDFEKDPPDHDKVVRELKVMMAVLEDEYKVKPMLYAQKDIYDQYLAEDFGDYPKWARNVYFPVYLDYGNNWAIWQYKDRGKLEGYAGGEEYIDLNVLNPEKTLDELTVKK